MEPWNPYRVSSPALDASMPPPAKRLRLTSPPSAFGDSGYGTASYVGSAASVFQPAEAAFAKQGDEPQDFMSPVEYHEPLTTQQEPASKDSGPSLLPKDKTKRAKPPPKDFKCINCGEVSKTESEYKKHQARHERPHKCQHHGCPKVHRGFSTVNDLNRHLKAKHGIAIPGLNDYKCLVPGCVKPDKIWPRLDNFRQHVARMHPGRPVDQVVQLSDQWFQAHDPPGHVSTPKVQPPSTSHMAVPREHLDSAIDAPGQSYHKEAADQTSTSAFTKQNSTRDASWLRQPRRRLSLSSAPGPYITPSRGIRQGREIATEGHRTPKLRPDDAEHDLDVLCLSYAPYQSPPDPFVSQPADATILGTDLASPWFDFVSGKSLNDMEANGEASNLMAFSPSSPLTETHVPEIMISPPSRAVTPANPALPTYNRPERDCSVIAQLQRVLSTFNSAEPHDADGDARESSGAVASSVADTNFGQRQVSKRQKLVGKGKDRQEDREEEDGDRGIPRNLSTAGPVDQPERFFGCPFNKYDAITYAGCQSYRTKTIDGMYRHHVLTYHVDRGHVDDATLARLDTLSRKRQRSPVDRWHAIYREVFFDQFQSFQISLPDPFWVPSITSTNLDDLVRATVVLSGTDMSAAHTVTANNTTSDSLAPFHRRVHRINELTDQAEELELQQVRRRWRAVRAQSLTRLATNSEFPPGVLYDFSTTSPVLQRAMAHPTSPPRQRLPEATASSPESLNLNEVNPESLGTAFPSPPIALPAAAFGMTSAERSQSRQSSPNDSGYESNQCPWYPTEDDPNLCSLCEKTKDLHDTRVMERFWEVV